MNELKKQIEELWEKKESLSPDSLPANDKKRLLEVLGLLDQGKIRVAEKVKEIWIVHEWIKKAILLYFKTTDNEKIEGGFSQFFDKVALKFRHYHADDFKQAKIRVVPPATVRQGAFIAPGAILMPSYVNIGAHVGEGTMVDTWATIGSCAQIGKNVHISGGAGIGGVLEPLQANPVIIEDHAFIGARSEVAEGVIVGEGAVISMGVFLGQSTKIYNRETKEITMGFIPPYAVVVPGTLPSKDGSYALQAAIIVKQVDAGTRKKVSINDLLRGA
ncbi:MAG: 2,3,4,5-tetrahydropyridine-2,6-dicarboxylate N-succinyltransferase [Nitrospirae bacterium]|nr:2,3,4,5-tetrahydropyridine-2,6-dicarboxylate N-succinyltransferase [Nitrospirota bacterium]MBI3351004.1 2,3,4,5-tetrahydropyridine-2,6-dicarboxylate N-succinyltransferase [Nitrospirota bacterium]